MRLHLAGPMRGLPYFNFVAFSAAAAALRAKGHEVTVPTEHDREVGFDPFKGVDPDPEKLHEMIAWNLKIIVRRAPYEHQIDGVVLLPGWRQSEGAKLEALVAERCGRARYLFDWDADGFLTPLRKYDFLLTTHTADDVFKFESAPDHEVSVVSP